MRVRTIRKKLWHVNLAALLLLFFARLAIGQAPPPPPSLLPLPTPIPTPNDFTISPQPISQTIEVGESTSYTISLSPIGVFNSSVNLSVSECPPGATCSFDRSPVTPPDFATLTVSTTNSTPAQPFTLIITGSGGGISHDTEATLIVTPQPLPTSSPGPGTPPTVSTKPAYGISPTDASLKGFVNPNGLTTTGWFEWGTTTSYGNQTKPQPMSNCTCVIAFVDGIGGLSPNTTYHFRVVAQNSAGISYGDDQPFTTPPDPTLVPPTVSTEPAYGIFQTDASLKGLVNPNGLTGYGWFEWGETTSYGNETVHEPAGNCTCTVAFVDGIGGLSPNTTYHFRVVAQNSAGISYGDDQSFTTSLTVSITLNTNPARLAIVADGTTYTSPQTFDWGLGSTHILSVWSPQGGENGTRYTFSGWSDGGTQTHTITVPSSNATYTANFNTQNSLTTSTNPSNGGSVSPSGTNWYNTGTSVSISATPNSGYTFTGWSGDVSGTQNPINVLMSNPKTIVANFSSSVSEPDIDITPKDQAGNPTLNFGSVRIFRSKALQFTISNKGKANLIVTKISDPSSPFSLVKPRQRRGQPPFTPFTLLPGASKAVKVKFNPNSVKAYTGVITITSNDSDEPTVTVNLSGTGR